MAPPAGRPSRRPNRGRQYATPHRRIVCAPPLPSAWQIRAPAAAARRRRCIHCRCTGARVAVRAARCCVEGYRAPQAHRRIACARPTTPPMRQTYTTAPVAVLPPPQPQQVQQQAAAPVQAATTAAARPATVAAAPLAPPAPVATTAGDDAPAARRGGPPPPAPPPPAPVVAAAASDGAAAVRRGGPPPPAPPPPAPSGPIERPIPPAGEGAHNALLASIRKGTSLKKVTPGEKKRGGGGGGGAGGGGAGGKAKAGGQSMQDALASQVAARRSAVQAHDSDSEEEAHPTVAAMSTIR